MTYNNFTPQPETCTIVVERRTNLLLPKQAPADGIIKDNRSVSTILEDIFWFFDGEVIDKAPNFKSLKKLLRLKSALVVFDEIKLARFDEDHKPMPMVVPTQ